MRRIAFLILTVACLAAGCSPESGPREPSYPEFDGRDPIPGTDDEAAEAPEDGVAGAEGGGESSFEKRLAKMRGGETRKDEQKRVSRQLVPLAGQLVTIIPRDRNQWTWSTDGQTTLMSYREAGSDKAVAVLYAERFSPLIRTVPSIEMNRFHRTVDPNLSQPLLPPSLESMATDMAAKKMGMPVGQLIEAGRSATTRTLGVGLNYRSSAETFTGWKWAGENEAGVKVQFGRTSGQWSSQPIGDSAALGALTQTASKLGDFQPLAERYQEMTETTERQAPSVRPAWMVVGYAATTEESGVHLAVICRAEPSCPVADSLADMLDTLRAPRTGELEATGRGADGGPAALADDLGLPFVPDDEMIPPEKLDSVLQSAGGSVPGP